MNEFNLKRTDTLLYLIGKESHKIVIFLKENIENPGINKLLIGEMDYLNELIQIGIDANVICDGQYPDGLYSVFFLGMNLLPSTIGHFFIKKEYIKPFIIGYGLSEKDIGLLIIQHVSKSKLIIESEYSAKLIEHINGKNGFVDKFIGNIPIEKIEDKVDKKKLPKGWIIIDGKK